MASIPQSNDRVHILPAIEHNEEETPPRDKGPPDNSVSEECICPGMLLPMGRSFQNGLIPNHPTVSVSVLTLINLLNYMDRFTIAGKCNFTLSLKYNYTIRYSHIMIL